MTLSRDCLVSQEASENVSSIKKRARSIPLNSTQFESTRATRAIDDDLSANFRKKAEFRKNRTYYVGSIGEVGWSVLSLYHRLGAIRVMA